MRALTKKHARFCTRSQRMIRNTLVNTKIFTNINIFQNILTNFQMLRETNSIGCCVDKGDKALLVVRSSFQYLQEFVT